MFCQRLNVDFSLPRIFAAAMLLVNKSNINWLSMVTPAVIFLPVAKGSFSGDMEGDTISQPVRLSLIKKSSKKSQALSIIGKISCRKLMSPLYKYCCQRCCTNQALLVGHDPHDQSIPPVTRQIS